MADQEKILQTNSTNVALVWAACQLTLPMFTSAGTTFSSETLRTEFAKNLEAVCVAWGKYKPDNTPLT